MRDLDTEQLRALWTLTAEELKRAGGKRDANALAFAVLLKFFQVQGRFPRGRAEIPDEVVRFVAQQVEVTASDLGFFEWSGRTIERHRAEIRDLLGFRECSVTDYTAATDWLVQHVTQVERQVEQVRAELLGWLRRQHLEPPGSARLIRIVRSGLDRGERLLIDRICAGLDSRVRGRLNELVFGVPDEPTAAGTDGEIEARDVLAWVKTDPGRLSLNTMLTEIGKLEAIRAVGLPVGLLTEVAPKVVTGWRVRAPTNMCFEECAFSAERHARGRRTSCRRSHAAAWTRRAAGGARTAAGTRGFLAYPRPASRSVDIP